MNGRCALPLAFVLSACATAPTSCPAGTKPMIRAELFFGGGPDPAAWQRFLDAEITPRFPDGLTVLDAYGQWRGRDGRILSEASKDLVVIAPDSAQLARTIDSVRDAYRRTFHQDSVLLAEAPVCAAF